MEMTIEMPMVADCMVSECAFNMENNCHARAITIGDGNNAGCDTFMSSTIHTKAMEQRAGVGACKVMGCTHNEDYECMASSISVGMLGQEVDCLTFAK